MHVAAVESAVQSVHAWQHRAPRGLKGCVNCEDDYKAGFAVQPRKMNICQPPLCLGIMSKSCALILERYIVQDN